MVNKRGLGAQHALTRVALRYGFKDKKKIHLVIIGTVKNAMIGLNSNRKSHLTNRSCVTDANVRRIEMKK